MTGDKGCAHGNTWVQAACSSQAYRPCLAILHTEFGINLEQVEGLEGALRYNKPDTPVWEAQLGPGGAQTDVELLLFPVHYRQHWV